MPLEASVRIVRELASRGYNADPEAVTLLAGAADPERAIERATEEAGDALVVTVEDVEAALGPADSAGPSDGGATAAGDPSVSTGNPSTGRRSNSESPVETKGSTGADGSPRPEGGGSRPSGDAAVEPGDATVEAGAAGTGTDDAAVEAADAGTGTGDALAETDDAGSGTGDVDAGTDDAAVEADDAEAGTIPGDAGSGPAPTSGDAEAEAGGGTLEEAGDGTLEEAGAGALEVANDVTGRSTGTGEYGDFVDVFRDRYKRLSALLRSRVNHRPASAIHDLPGGSDAAMVGMVEDVRSTSGGHRLVELEDTSGTFPCLVLSDRAFAEEVERLLLDEVVAVEGSLADDGGVLFVDALHFPDVPRTHEPSTADRHVQAALVSDVHVGSQEFLADAWERFADWLHGEEAAAVEYLLVAGDMVEGVGVYPGQDEELSIVDIYEQYEQFAEHLKSVPGDLDIVMIPGNHDAVRLAEPQPGFDEELRSIMSAHDARVVGNPATVTVEGVSVLMYHGVSLDEVIAELPAADASYDAPADAMTQLLRKRHLAPQFGGQTRLAPEERDYMVVEEVPDVFHAGHVHKLGVGRYHGVTVVNSGCWQAQTAFQRSVNIDPDAGYAPILDLDTLDVTVRKFT